MKRPWIAATLSVIFPGLGHAYLRKWIRTAMWLAILISAVWVMIPPELIPQDASFEAIFQASREIPEDSAFAIMGLRILNVIDAYVIAKQEIRQRTRQVEQKCPECGHELEDASLSFCPWCGTELEERPPRNSRDTDDDWFQL